MEPQSSLPYSQAPANCAYPESTPSSPYNPFPFPEDPSYMDRIHILLQMAAVCLNLCCMEENCNPILSFNGEIRERLWRQEMGRGKKDGDDGRGYTINDVQFSYSKPLEPKLLEVKRKIS